MKKVLGIFVFLALIILAGYMSLRFARLYTRSQLAQTVTPTDVLPTPIPTVTIKNPSKKSLFIPYWSIPSASGDLQDYTTLLYFGIAATENGIDTSDPGYTNLQKFVRLPSSKKKLLVLRMIDSRVNSTVLASKQKQQMIITQATKIAKENGFAGIVLDLEISAIPFDSLITQISDFSNAFGSAAKTRQLSYGIAIYGDAFYRIRPFDVKALANSADQIYVMAYDFSKANANPGPTFPLKGKDTYGYDYESMLADFLKAVPPDKLTVVFGLFGYDWAVDDKQKATGRGEAITAKEAEGKFMQGCSAKSCSWKRDDQSFGIQVSYIDNDNTPHIVWVDDLQAAAAKEEFLKQRGITNFSYWAYSYF